MPSCQACGKWFSEEDSGCGCDGEVIHMTRRGRRMLAARVLREVADIWDVGGGAYKHIASVTRKFAAQYEAGVREVPSE